MTMFHINICRLALARCEIAEDQGRLGPKRGGKCYVTPAFSGIPKQRGTKSEVKTSSRGHYDAPGGPKYLKVWVSSTSRRPNSCTARALRLRLPLCILFCLSATRHGGAGGTHPRPGSLHRHDHGWQRSGAHSQVEGSQVNEHRWISFLPVASRGAKRAARFSARFGLNVLLCGRFVAAQCAHGHSPVCPTSAKTRKMWVGGTRSGFGCLKIDVYMHTNAVLVADRVRQGCVRRQGWVRGQGQ